MLLLLLASACQPGPPLTPTLPPALDFTVTPVWNSPTPSPTWIPSRTPTAALQPTIARPSPVMTSTESPAVMTATPLVTLDTGWPTISAVTLLPTAPILVATPSTVSLPQQDGDTPMPQTLHYSPIAGVNALPIPAQIPVDSLPLLPSNPGFDDGSIQQGAPEIVVPQGWVAWWRTGPIDCTPYLQLQTDGPCPLLDEPGLSYRRPEFTVIPGEGRWLDPPRVDGSGQAARFFCTYGICVAGYLQRVQVQPGRYYTLRALVQAWCSDTDDPYHSQLATRDDQLNCEMAVGIDPSGGVDPLSAAIIWQTISAYDSYVYVSTPPMLAERRAMTLFLRGRSLWGFRHNDFHFDRVSFDSW